MKAAGLLLIVLGGLITAFGVIYAISVAQSDNGINLPVLVAAVIVGGMIDLAGAVLLIKSQRSI
jgi:hypothetical protein